MFLAQHLPYRQTHAFSKLVLDYVEAAGPLRPFYAHPPTLEGIQEAIRQRQQFATNRPVLVASLKRQYGSLTPNAAVLANIEALLAENTFTVCTAHQPNLFTGPLYFVYKVLHAIRLAQYLGEQLPAYRFVPVYYMGSEDADFAELNHTWVDGKKIEWKKEQTGAVGRMVVDDTLLHLIDELEGQLVYEPFGKEVISLLRQNYVAGRTIQEATFGLVNELYGSWGLVVLIADNPLLKAEMKKVFADDLFQHIPARLVTQTSEELDSHYKVQAHPRDINLFYLKDSLRERIEERDGRFFVLNTSLEFTAAQLQSELEAHPERFSPNVILRGLFQETILPNLAFVGGGGETAYWLQLKNLFGHYGVPYPVLVLRNSFLVVEEKWQQKVEKTGLTLADLFHTTEELMKQVVAQNAGNTVSLAAQQEQVRTLYRQIEAQAGTIDPTLQPHVAALAARTLQNLAELEKKMFRAEKRKYADRQRQIEAVKDVLFPCGGLQERVENFSGLYAKWGKGFLEAVLQHSPELEPLFTVLREKE